MSVRRLVAFCVMLVALARERGGRIAQVAAPERERDLLDVAIHRTGRTLASDRAGLAAVEVVLGTAVDAVGASAGRARFARTHEATTFEAMPGEPGAALAPAMLAAERVALSGRDGVEVYEREWHALSEPVRRRGSRESEAAMSVCRSGRPFSPRERLLFRHLVAQVGASLEQADLLERVRDEPPHDPFASLAGRRTLTDELVRVVERAEHEAAPLCALALDVDDLGELNIVHGEAAGDAVLRAVAELAREHCGLGDLAARYEEDTLVVLLAGMSLEEAEAVAENLRSGVERTSVRTPDGDVEPTISVGLAERTPGAPSGEALLDAALRALAAAKALGKNRCVAAAPPA